MTGLLAVGIHGLSELLPNWSNSSDAPLCPAAPPPQEKAGKGMPQDTRGRLNGYGKAV